MGPTLHTTPFALVSAVAVVRQGPKRALIAISRGLEHEALTDPPARAAAVLQDVRYVTASTRQAYARLATRGTAVRLYARGLQAWLAPGVTGVALPDDDPWADQWAVVLTGSDHPVAFAAADCRAGEPDELRRPFRWAMTRDPDVVEEVARSLGSGRPDHRIP